MQNIQFDYLFRDEDNYKEFGSVVYGNPQKLTIEFVDKQIKKHLIEGTWFNPDQWQVPRFSFHQLNAFGIHDYLWYEFEGISYTNKSATSDYIDELLKRIANKN